MISGTLSEFGASLGAEVFGGDTRFKGLSTDTRSVAAGQLFVALRGPRFDGHAFVSDAVAAGAAAVVVEAAVEDLGVPQLIVPDSYQALGQLTRFWRKKLMTPLAAVTGSNGKTTVRNMLAAILRQDYEVLVTQGNLNNEVGVPLTLAQLGGQHQQAVIEVACSRRGDIAYLADLVRPDVAVVTNAAEAHLEGLGDVHGVAVEKGALFEALTSRGWAVLNADDLEAPHWRQVIGDRRTVTFGESDRVDVRMLDYESRGDAGCSFSLAGAHGSVSVDLPLGGRHNAVNAAAAAAAALVCGSTAESIAPGLAAVTAEPGRQRLLNLPGDVRLIDDSYNANPGSMRAAIQYAVDLGRRVWLALGAMGELGPDAERAHAELGRFAAQVGVERLFAVGTGTEPLANAARKAGLAEVQHYAEHVQALAAIIEGLEGGITLLVKGSRSAAMERVVRGVAVHQQRGAS